jgi:prepilin-type N-terminal cleavage/methylation domain-containing protein
MRMEVGIRRAFTLLEIMIALALLCILGTVTAVQVKKMVDRHRFEAEVAGLFSALQEAQVLSATYQTDLALDIEREKGQLVYYFSTDEPFPAHMVPRRPVSLAHTDAVQFKGVKVAQCHFDIYPGGRVEPGGILSFHCGHETDEALWLDLQRSPLLKCSHRKPLSVLQHIPNMPVNQRMTQDENKQPSI